MNHEYIISYAKNLKCLSLGWVIDPNTRVESNLWNGYAENSITKNGPANPPSKILLRKGFPCKSNDVILKKNNIDDSFWEDINNVGYITRQITEKYNISYPIRLGDINIKNKKISCDVEVFSGWANANKLKIFIENGYKNIIEEDGEISFYLTENGVIYYNKKRTKSRNILSVLRNMGTTEQMRSQLERDGLFFSYPKPVQLICYMVKIGMINTSDIILDFFAGSSTTAHAVMQLNAEDGGKRQFIMVQLPEPCDEKSEACRAGYKTIAEISKERIRRAGKKIKEELLARNAQKGQAQQSLLEPSGHTGGADLDIGFRVLKVDTSNMADVFYAPDKVEQKTLLDAVDNIKYDRTPEDLLFQVLLDWGVELTLPIRRESIQGKTVFFVDANALAACFDKGISRELVEEIARVQPMRVIFRDNGFVSDAMKINAEQIFKQLSPSTEFRTL